MIDCSKKPGKVFGGGCLVVAERALYVLEIAVEKIASLGRS